MFGKVKLYIYCLILAMLPFAAFAQTTEDIIVKIYAEELNYIAKNRIEYLNERAGRSAVTRENVLATISGQGVSLQEYVGARSVASAKPEYNKFLTSHRLSDEEELELFNNYVRAFLKDYSGKSKAEDIPAVDFNLLRTRTKNKVKTEAPEPVTGGVMWTLSNEMRVICKTSQPKGRFSYSLVIRGGFSEIQGLGTGEGPYVGDMLGLFDISGMKWYDFKRFLNIRGISMDCKVSISDMEIYGSAPVSELRTLFVALSSVANERSFNTEAFERYNEDLKKKGNEVNPAASADSLMRPDYRYTQFRYLCSLPGDFPSRVEKYFDTQFSRVNDGVIILAGDLNPLDVQKTVEQTTGGFRTSRAYSVRPMVQYVMRSGNSSIILNSSNRNTQRADIIVSAEMPVTSASYMALKIARIELGNRLKAKLKNAEISVKETIEYFPSERVFVAVSCREPKNPVMLMVDLKAAVEEALKTDIGADALKTDKAVLTDELGRRLSGPRGSIEAARLRYSDGKDFMNGYKGKVSGVKSSDVNAVFKALASGSGVDISFR